AGACEPRPGEVVGARRRVQEGARRAPPDAAMTSGVRARNASAWLVPHGDTHVDHRLRRDMRRYDERDEVDIVIVGCGAGGGVLTQRLARAGWRVVTLDAGPFWDPDRDWVSDEAGSNHIYWTEPRVIAGEDPVPLGSNNSGRGVGGSMVHFAGYAPRHPQAPHPIGGNGMLFQAGALKAGITVKVGPVAIVNGRFGNRNHCIYRGFCLQGCKVNAKASPLITHVPDALAHGAEIRADAMVSRIETDRDGRYATGVRYFLRGREHFQAARMVAVAGYSLETPRLLLNSANARHPDGLCNEHDLVGRYLMVQGAPQTAGRFAEEVRMYKAPPPEATCEEFYETDPLKDYKRGFSIQNVSPLPITWAEHVSAQGHWGDDLRT